MSVSTDNDFEVIGLSDCESLGQNQEATVLIQLPDAFQNRSHLAPSETVSSVATSYVTVQQHDAEGVSTIPSEDDVKSVAASDSSWSHVPRSGTVEEASVSSALDVLPISGSKSLACLRCTFINQEDDEVCVLCDTPLVVIDSSLDADQQLALHYQKEEIELSQISEMFQSTTSAEKLTPEERRALCSDTLLAMNDEDAEDALREISEVLLSSTADDLTLEERRALYSNMLLEEQATQLSHEIIECINRSHCNGMTAFALSDLVAHVTSFISEMRALGDRKPRVLLRYHFSNESTTGTYETIRKNGFPKKCHVSTNIKAAYDDKKRYSATARIRIPESSMHLDTRKHGGRCANLKDRKLGWIIATIDVKLYQSQRVKVSSGWATMEDRSGMHCLPLISFDASLRRSDSIRRLMNGLSDVLLVSDLFVPAPKGTPREKENKFTNENSRGSLGRAPGTEVQNPFEAELYQKSYTIRASRLNNLIAKNDTNNSGDTTELPEHNRMSGDYTRGIL